MITGAGLLLLIALGRDPADTTFLDRARIGTARFRDVTVAQAEGYRPIGPDAPGMGRHYVNPLLVMRGQVTPDRPQALSYARMGDSLVLVAVAWVVPIDARGGPPAIEGTEGHWHAHSRSVIEEGNLFGHEMRAVVGVETGVVMLHAWVALANDAGPYAPDNWRLPFFRHGLAIPRTPTDAEAKALGLGDDTEGFYAAQFAHHGAPRDRVADALGHYTREILEWLAARPAGTALTEDELEWLGTRWDRILKEMEP